MRIPFWRVIVLMCLVQGLATAFSPIAGMLAGWFIALYLVIRLFFVDHPAAWWYDLLFLATAAGVALAGAVVFAAVCMGLPWTGITTRSCLDFSFERALVLHLTMLCVMGGILWLSLRTWLWWKFRKRR